LLELAPLWSAVRERLERQGLDARGRIRVPQLDASSRLALQSLLGAPLRQTVDLTVLEAALRDRGIGDSLAEALTLLDHPLDGAREQRRAMRRERATVLDLARSMAAEWDDTWSAAWVDGLIRRGLLRELLPDEAAALLRSCRSVVDAIVGGAASSRTDLAARVLGSSHALDTGSRTEAAVALALRLISADDDGDVWERFGVMTDHVSSPALTWGMPIVASSGLSELTQAAARLSVAVHLSRDVLRRHPAIVEPGTVVLVTENPRVVEAAAQRRAPFAVVTTNGNPSSAVQLLLQQLLDSRAELRYHGDFDTPGLAICGRMMAMGLVPWRMTEADYRAAVEQAEREGVALPPETRPCGLTPWDPGLAQAMNELASIVHEERLLDDLLA
jgi:uncharacterized protein (TIGR02679 family)